jgi:hypothetical protein
MDGGTFCVEFAALIPWKMPTASIMGGTCTLQRKRATGRGGKVTARR